MNTTKRKKDEPLSPARAKNFRPDVGWYQIRKALQARNASGDVAPVSFKPFEDAYKY